MSKRFTINTLAITIVVAGGTLLAGAPPVQAANLDGCDRLESAKTQDQSWCESNNGSWSVTSSSCSSTGYTLTTKCLIQMT